MSNHPKYLKLFDELDEPDETEEMENIQKFQPSSKGVQTLKQKKGLKTIYKTLAFREEF